MDRKMFIEITKEVLLESSLHFDDETAEEVADSIYDRCDEQGLFDAEYDSDYD